MSAIERPGQDDATATVMDAATAFAAVALAAVTWDSVLTVAGTRALRHALDYRPPYNRCSNREMLALMDRLLVQLRDLGAEGLMRRAGGVLDARQRHTAYAMAAEIMRSDGPLSVRERAILADLAARLDLAEHDTTSVLEVMDVLHDDVLAPPAIG